MWLLFNKLLVFVECKHKRGIYCFDYTDTSQRISSLYSLLMWHPHKCQGVHAITVVVLLLSDFYRVAAFCPVMKTLRKGWMWMRHMEKNSLRLQNTHAGNSEHIYHFSWCFVRFRNMQLKASVPEDVSRQAGMNRRDHSTWFCIWEIHLQT